MISGQKNNGAAGAGIIKMLTDLNSSITSANCPTQADVDEMKKKYPSTFAMYKQYVTNITAVCKLQI